MTGRVFLAGATGAIGKRLTPLLRNAGYHIAGTTRSAGKADLLRHLGAEPVVVDVFDAGALAKAVAAFRPDVIVHQLTDLPPGLDPSRMAEATARNARIRDEGTCNLVAAAKAAGVKRLVAQSIAWAYADGPTPHGEDDPLDRSAEGGRAVSIAGVIALESQVLHSPPIAGTVLRYGRFYGPGTGVDSPSGTAPLHVDAAAFAALCAIQRNATGIFNIAQPNTYASTEKAMTLLGWDPEFRLTTEPSR